MKAAYWFARVVGSASMVAGCVLCGWSGIALAFVAYVAGVVHAITWAETR